MSGAPTPLPIEACGSSDDLRPEWARELLALQERILEHLGPRLPMAGLGVLVLRAQEMGVDTIEVRFLRGLDRTQRMTHHLVTLQTRDNSVIRGTGASVEEALEKALNYLNHLEKVRRTE